MLITVTASESLLGKWTWYQVMLAGYPHRLNGTGNRAGSAQTEDTKEHQDGECRRDRGSSYVFSKGLGLCRGPGN